MEAWPLVAKLGRVWIHGGARVGIADMETGRLPNWRPAFIGADDIDVAIHPLTVGTWPCLQAAVPLHPCPAWFTFFKCVVTRLAVDDKWVFQQLAKLCVCHGCDADDSASKQHSELSGCKRRHRGHPVTERHHLMTTIPPPRQSNHYGQQECSNHCRLITWTERPNN